MLKMVLLSDHEPMVALVALVLCEMLYAHHQRNLCSSSVLVAINMPVMSVYSDSESVEILV